MVFHPTGVGRSCSALDGSGVVPSAGGQTPERIAPLPLYLSRPRTDRDSHPRHTCAGGAMIPREGLPDKAHYPSPPCPPIGLGSREGQGTLPATLAQGACLRCA